MVLDKTRSGAATKGVRILTWCRHHNSPLKFIDIITQNSMDFLYMYTAQRHLSNYRTSLAHWPEEYRELTE